MLSWVLVFAACHPSEFDLHTAPDRDGDGWIATMDCDDADPAVHPEADEDCDGVDDDCDGAVDDGLLSPWFLDEDADAYGALEDWILACAPVDGRVQAPGDCDDHDPDLNPAREEVCNGLDDDCDGTVDDGLLGSWHADADGDGAGDPAVELFTCAPPPGFVADDSDCDDAHAEAAPGNPEVCDGLDDDCDGEIDEGLLGTWWVDVDLDGFGGPVPIEACEAPPGSSAIDGDCDDLDPAVWPDAPERCNGVDDDCDGQIDESDLWWFVDADGDGHGDPAATVNACAQPPGTVAADDDCDDADSTAFPGAPELCDGADDDCDGDVDEGYGASWLADADGDGWGDDEVPLATTCDPPGPGWVGVAFRGDCDDARAAVHPGAPETCDGTDEDCDGAVDDGLLAIWYADDDADGWGDPARWEERCDPSPGEVDRGGDCDDGDASVPPGCSTSLAVDWPTTAADPARTRHVSGFAGDTLPVAAWSWRGPAYRDVQAVVAGDTVYVAVGLYSGASPSLVALDLADGAERWRVDWPGERGISHPTVAYDGVYVSIGEVYTSPGRVERRDALTGALDWSVTADAGALGVLVADGLLVAPDVQAWDALTGDPVWTAPSQRYLSYVVPSAADGRAWFPGELAWDEGELGVLDLASGDPLWTWPVEGTLDAWVPLLDGDAAFGSRYALSRFDRDLGPRWTQQLGEWYGPVGLASGTVYGVREGTAQAVLAGSGALVRAMPGNGELIGGLALTDDVLVVTTDDVFVPAAWFYRLHDGQLLGTIPDLWGEVAIAQDHLLVWHDEELEVLEWTP